MSELYYKSTRSDSAPVTASQAILQGLARDGGLFVPSAIPKLSVSMKELASMPYQEVAYQVMKEFLTDFTEEELRWLHLLKAYDEQVRYRKDRPSGKGGGYVLSGAFPWRNDRIQGYGAVDPAASDDSIREEERY